MFRNLILRAIVTVLTGSSAAVAATGVPMSPGDVSTAARPYTYALDTERYLQTELDWRSYYLNRSSAPRDGAPLEPHAAPQLRLRHGG